MVTRATGQQQLGRGGAKVHGEAEIVQAHLAGTQADTMPGGAQLASTPRPTQHFDPFLVLAIRALALDITNLQICISYLRILYKVAFEMATGIYPNRF